MAEPAKAKIKGVPAMKPNSLLWLDASTKSMPEKVALADVRYRRKFGNVPDLCYVHPSTPDVPCRVGVVEVKARGFVSRNYFQIGEKKTK